MPAAIPDDTKPCARSFRDDFERGKFMVFGRPSTGNASKRKLTCKLYIGEVYADCDRINESVSIPMCDDFGPNDDLSYADPTSPVRNRLLRPVY